MRPFPLFLAVPLVFAFCVTARAQVTFTYDGGTGGTGTDWQVADNWDDGLDIPDDSDSRADISGSFTVNNNPNGSIGELNVSNGADVTVDNSLTISSGGSLTGNVSVNGATLTLGAAFNPNNNVTVTNSGTLDLDGNIVESADGGDFTVTDSTIVVGTDAEIIGFSAITITDSTVENGSFDSLDGNDIDWDGGTIDNVTISDVGTLTIVNTLNVASGSTVSGDVNVGDGGTAGTLEVTRDADSSDPLEVNSLTVEDDSTIAIHLNDAGDTGFIDATAGDVDITDSTLRIEFDDQVEPGNTYAILGYDSLMGTFGSIQIIGNTDPLLFFTIDYVTGDQITLTSVPEPSSVALLGITLAGLCWQLRRRKQRVAQAA